MRSSSRRTFSRVLLMSVWLAAIVPSWLPAQVPPDTPVLDLGDLSVEMELKSRGFDISNESLQQLLVRPVDDIWVRVMAAQLLAGRGVKESVPAIHKLFAEAEEKYVRYDLACSLAVLGDAQGREALHAMCDSGDPGLSYSAATCSRNLGDRYCLKVAIDLAIHGESEKDRSDGIYFVESFGSVAGVDATKEILPYLLAALSEKPLRQAASQALAMLRNPQALPELRKAVEAEEDPELRSWMAKQLVILEQAEREKG